MTALNDAGDGVGGFEIEGWRRFHEVLLA